MNIVYGIRYLFLFSNCGNEKGEKKRKLINSTELSKKGNKKKLKIRKDGKKKERKKDKCPFLTMCPLPPVGSFVVC
jgi:hypothetical protein